MRYAIVLALALTGCATGYQSSGFGGGFSEMRMAQDTYAINYRGNAFTGMDQVQEMATLRAAELTLQSGYTHFAILGANESSDRAYYNQPGTTTTTIQPTGFGNYQAQSSTYGGYSVPIDKPKTQLIVKMMGAGQGGLDAQEVYQQIAPRYIGQ